MKKFLITAVIIGIFFTNPKVFAYEIFWYDNDCGFDKFAKIVLFPLSNKWENSNKYRLGKEGTKNFRLNSYVDDRLTKKLKKINFIRLANEIQEKDDILTNTLGNLLADFENENARALAVEEATMADMYIVPQFRENRVQKDISPRREWDVELKSWTEETGGPEGDKKYNEKTRTVHHVIEETPVYLHIMQVEFTGYNNKAEKILTSLQQDRRYNTGEESQFKRLVDDFQKSFTDARKEKNSTKGEIRISFNPVEMQGNLKDDIYFSNAMDYALQISAMKKIKKARVTKNSSSALVNYYLRSTVNRCELVPVWHDPSYSVYNKLVDSKEEKWYDKDGNEHKKKIYHYDQDINSYLAGWSFYWRVISHFWLVDTQNNVIISKPYSKTDDKPVDAYRHAAEDFCKQVNSFLKEKTK